MPTFDPSKTYSWSSDDKFEITGEEFGAITNALRAILNTEEAKKIMLANQAHEALNQVVSRAVEAGIAKETDA